MTREKNLFHSLRSRITGLQASEFLDGIYRVDVKNHNMKGKMLHVEI